MKKLLAICFAVLLVASMSFQVFAEGGFVISPSKKPAPEVDTFEPSDDECTAELIITPYKDRDQLPEDRKDRIEEAYDEISDSDDLTDLIDDLKDLADKKNIDGKDLAVSDLFDARTEGCDNNHDQHSPFDVVLEADTLSNFVGLAYKDENGKWILVEGATVVNGDHLKFKTDGFGPFAIIVDASKQGPSQTGDETMIGLYIAIMAVSAVAIVILVVKTKKQRA